MGAYRYITPLFCHFHSIFLLNPDFTNIFYSQGAALTHRAIESLPKKAMKKISGVVLYRDIQNLQDKGRIPNFSRAKTLIICNEGDVICAGNLTIAYPHISYIARVPEALSFFADQVGNTRT